LFGFTAKLQLGDAEERRAMPLIPDTAVLQKKLAELPLACTQQAIPFYATALRQGVFLS